MLELIYSNKEIRTMTTPEGERYWNLQSMADACGSTKRVRSWINLDTTKEYITALSEFSSVSDSRIVRSNRTDKKNDSSTSWVVTEEGGNNPNVGTWIHEELVTAAARWLDPKFSVWCDQMIRKYLEQGYLLSSRVNETQVKKLMNDIESKEFIIKNLKQQISDENSERQAHKVFSFLYDMAGREKLKAEYHIDGRYFDYFSPRKDRVVITEIKSRRVTPCIIRHELEQSGKGQLDILKRFYDNHGKHVQYRFLAPDFSSKGLALLESYNEVYNWICFSSVTWMNEVINVKNHMRNHNNLDKRNDDEIGKLLNELANIADFRN